MVFAFKDWRSGPIDLVWRDPKNDSNCRVCGRATQEKHQTKKGLA